MTEDMVMLVLCFVVMLVIIAATLSNMIRRVEDRVTMLHSILDEYRMQQTGTVQDVGQLSRKIEDVESSIDKMKETISKVDEVIEEYSEAAHLAKEGEKLYSEGLNNILNYSAPLFKKDDGVK